MILDKFKLDGKVALITGLALERAWQKRLLKQVQILCA